MAKVEIKSNKQYSLKPVQEIPDDSKVALYRKVVKEFLDSEEKIVEIEWSKEGFDTSKGWGIRKAFRDLNIKDKIKLKWHKGKAYLMKTEEGDEDE